MKALTYNTNFENNYELIQKEKEAFPIFKEKVAAHKLDMKLIETHFLFEEPNALFFFSSDNRVDFRELVKDLVSIFKMRIELRQIGVRDEARITGGLGVCGRPFCCSSFLSDFQPVSIKMAKEQGLSLNPVKISGTCGRLMCCLKYEQNVYEELIKITPKLGSLVQTKDGKGIVVETSVLAGKVKVRPEDNPEATPQSYSIDEIKVLRGGRGKPAPTVPDIEE